MSDIVAQPAILLTTYGTPESLVLDVTLANWENGRATLSFIEQRRPRDGGKPTERLLGTVEGTAQENGPNPQRGRFIPDDISGQRAENSHVRFRFDLQSHILEYEYQLEMSQIDEDEGDRWWVLVRSESHAVESQSIPVARIRRQVEQRGVTYDWHDGHEVAFYNDGSTDAFGTAGAFRDLHSAITEAQHFIFVVDWSFQPMFWFDRSKEFDTKSTIGSTLIKKALGNKDLVVAIHTWNHSAVGAPDDANNSGDDALDALVFDHALEEKRPDNLLWRATSRSGTGWSHHQKFVVLDAPAEGGRRTLKAFWGGLDLTQGRFDWPEHLVAPNLPGVALLRETLTSKDGKHGSHDWYNPEFADSRALLKLPRQPWHDIHGALTGPAAWDFVREFVGRWVSVSPEAPDLGDIGAAHLKKLWSKYRDLHTDRKTFVQAYEGKLEGPWSVQVYRSISLEHWRPPRRPPADALDGRLYASLATDQVQGAEASIQLAYRHNIDRAERFIYIENQYFMGSGKYWKRPSLKNDIPERLVQRVLQQARSEKPFHVYIVLPMFPEGDPVSSANCQVRLNQWSTIEYMLKALKAGLKTGKKWTDYLSFYFLANWGAVPTERFSKSKSREGRVQDHMRYMVYVHSKLMIVDDRYALFGSCNLNDRGLTGARDSEIACGIWPSHSQHAVASELKAFRKRLWTEHFGDLPAAWETPEHADCVEAARLHAKLNYENFRSMAAEPKGHICRIPLALNQFNRLILEEWNGPSLPDHFGCLPDAPDTSRPWQWSSDGSSWLKYTDLAD